MTRGALNVDFQIFIIRDQFWLGANLRSTYKIFSIPRGWWRFWWDIWSESSNNLMVSYAYSYSLGKNRGYNDGSHEIILRFKLFNKEKALIESSRYF